MNGMHLTADADDESVGRCRTDRPQREERWGVSEDASIVGDGLDELTEVFR
jgi:hypothetical protein